MTLDQLEDGKIKTIVNYLEESRLKSSNISVNSPELNYQYTFFLCPEAYDTANSKKHPFPVE